MTHHRADLLHAALLAANLADNIDPATRHLRRELDYYDSLPTTTDANISGRQQADTTVEHAVIQRQLIADNLTDIDLHVRGVTTMLLELTRLVHQASGTRTPPPRCEATGRQGAIEWGDPTCWDIPARGKLCQRCYMRERRWRQAHGLPTRDDVAA
jgi:hypothetical protein